MATNPAHPWRYLLSDVSFGPEEAEAARRVVASGWLSQGPEGMAFEAEFAACLGVPAERVVAVSSGTAALHLALAVLGVGPGDEVIVPALTFVASANAARYVGARPVFADIRSPEDPTLDPADAAARAGPRTRAVVAVHYAGRACDLEALAALAARRGAVLVEDAAHAPGATLGGRPLGTIGQAGCFSFFANKNLTSGEGGAVVFAEAEAAARARRARSHGMSAASWDKLQGHAFDYEVEDLGWNYRLPEVAAAIARVQLGRLPAMNARRAALDAAYRARLAGCAGLGLPLGTARGTPACHLLPVLLAPGRDRRVFQERLRAAGVQTSVHYPPVHLFGAYRRLAGAAGPPALPRTEDFARREVSLPLHPGLSEADVAVIGAEVERALG